MGPEVEARLREVIKPGHPDNPFRPRHQARNYALLMLYLELPLRRAEALNIKAPDLALDGPKPLITIHRRADDKDDPRGVQPLTKTSGRVLALGEELREILSDWILRHRSDKARYPGAKRTPYVFVSERGLPIGLATVSDMFKRLRTRVPGLPPTLCAHVLRHSWNDRFSELADAQNLPEATEEKLRGYQNGWKDGSKSALTYTRRHTRVAADKASLAMQKKSLEGRNR